MSDYAARKEVQEIVNAASEKIIADLSEVIGSFATQVDTRFNKLEARADKHDEHYNRLLYSDSGRLLGQIR